jgi:hypothetical protein
MREVRHTQWDALSLSWCAPRSGIACVFERECATVLDGCEPGAADFSVLGCRAKASPRPQVSLSKPLLPRSLIHNGCPERFTGLDPRQRRRRPASRLFIAHAAESMTGQRFPNAAADAARPTATLRLGVCCGQMTDQDGCEDRERIAPPAQRCGSAWGSFWMTRFDQRAVSSSVPAERVGLLSAQPPNFGEDSYEFR